MRVKLKYLQEWTEQRRNNARLYNELLKGIPVSPPFESPHVRAVYHLYVIRVADGKRDGLRNYLLQKGISCGVHYPVALPNLKAYAYLGHRPQDFPVASRYCDEILSLPMFPELSREQIEYVAHSIRSFFETH